jgi:hypothetical protein
LNQLFEKPIIKQTITPDSSRAHLQ